MYIHISENRIKVSTAKREFFANHIMYIQLKLRTPLLKTLKKKQASLRQAGYGHA